MQRLFDYIDSQKKILHDHPMLIKSRDLNRAVPVENRFDWAPAFIHLSQTFRDLNQFLLPYPNPQNEYELALTEHCKEDASHWKLFLEDLQELGFNQNDDLNETIQYIWQEQSFPVRKYIYLVISRFFKCEHNVFLRAAYMEANEATVKMFFKVSALNARFFTEKTGKILKYFGSEHIDREINEAVEQNIFLEADVPEEIIDQAIQIAEEHFNSFKEFMDFKYSVTKTFESQASRWPSPYQEQVKEKIMSGKS